MKKTTTEMIEEMRTYEVNPDLLYVVKVGEDFLVGEVSGPAHGPFMDMTNPKRIIRLQRIVGTTGLEIELLITDYDMLADMKDVDNVISIAPIMRYRVLLQNDATIQNVLSHLISYYESKKLASAAEAGIVIPQTPSFKSPFKK